MSRPRLLVLDASVLPDWGPALPDAAEVSVLDPAGEARRIPSGGAWGAPGVLAALDTARRHAGRFDYVLAECAAAFRWHCAFRLAGDATPFLIVPRFNCVHAKDSYALFLSAQLAGPRDTLYCGSECASRAFGMFGVRCSPRFLPGIDLNRFRTLEESRADSRAALGVADGRAVLLYVGRMADDKNVLELLQAVRIVRESRDVELVLCFRFPRDAYLRRCAEEAVAAGGARFVPDPDVRTLVRWYNAADLVVNPAVSIFETFGRVPVEAMACGTPPVVSAYNGCRETVTEECGFLVPTTCVGDRKWPDVASFARTIVDTLDDRATLERKAQAGRARARDYERGACVRAALAELASVQRPDAAQRGGTVRLDGLAPEVAQLWAPLEGDDVSRLAGDFLVSDRVPVRPAEAQVREFYRAWFSQY